MGLVPRFTAADIRAKLEKDAAKILKVIVLRMQYLGEQCVNQARNLDTYKDRTANLRNSIGYIVAVDGKSVKTDFKQTLTGEPDPENKNGVKVGKEYALEILSKSKSKGVVLIVVAGMEYAEHVETLGYDVLTSAELLAKKELPGMIRQIKERAKRMK